MEELKPGDFERECIEEDCGKFTDFYLTVAFLRKNTIKLGFIIFVKSDALEKDTKLSMLIFPPKSSFDVVLDESVELTTQLLIFLCETKTQFSTKNHNFLVILTIK